jgi:hypothetical protein
MQRVFTQDVGSWPHNGEPRWKRGKIQDYPLATWRDIERSAGKSFEVFSKPIESTDVPKKGGAK